MLLRHKQVASEKHTWSNSSLTPVTGPIHSSAHPCHSCTCNHLSDLGISKQYPNLKKQEQNKLLLWKSCQAMALASSALSAANASLLQQ